MLQQVSWQTFLTAIASILIGYYVVIGYLYYRGDLLAKFRQLARPGKPGLQANAGPGIQMEEHREHGALMAGFMGELKALTTASGHGCNKNELLFALGRLLDKYAPLKESSLKEEINTLIMDECRENCSLSIDQTEMKVLWNG
jgi:hypothetical protein